MAESTCESTAVEFLMKMSNRIDIIFAQSPLPSPSQVSKKGSNSDKPSYHPVAEVSSSSVRSSLKENATCG